MDLETEKMVRDEVYSLVTDPIMADTVFAVDPAWLYNDMTDIVIDHGLSITYTGVVVSRWGKYDRDIVSLSKSQKDRLILTCNNIKQIVSERKKILFEH